VICLMQKTRARENTSRFTPDNAGLYTIHVTVMLPDRSVMDNHMDFSVIAE